MQTNSMYKIRLKFAPKQFKRGPGETGRARLVRRAHALAVACRRFARKAQTQDADWAEGVAATLDEIATRPASGCEGGVAVRWCPRCGSCTCPYDDRVGYGDDAESIARDCPIHGAASQHEASTS